MYVLRLVAETVRVVTVLLIVDVTLALEKDLGSSEAEMAATSAVRMYEVCMVSV